MKQFDDHNITFRYRNTRDTLTKLNVSDDERLKNESIWKQKIISNHKGALVPNNLEVQVLVSDDGEHLLRVFHMKYR